MSNRPTKLLLSAYFQLSVASMVTVSGALANVSDGGPLPSGQASNTQVSNGVSRTVQQASVPVTAPAQVRQTIPLQAPAGNVSRYTTTSASSPSVSTTSNFGVPAPATSTSLKTGGTTPITNSIAPSNSARSPVLQTGNAVSTAKSKVAPKGQDGADADWAKLQKIGSEAIDSGQYGVAERTLKQAVIKSVVFGEGDLRYAKSLDELGRLLTIRARFGEAEPLLEEALHAKELTLDRETGQIIPAYGSMATFYLDHGTEAKAAPVAEKLLAFVTGKLDDYRMGTQGPVTLKKGQPLTGWAGRADTTMVNPVIEWAITCDAVGNTFKSHGNFDMADRLFKAALDVKETVLGKEHLSLANSFDSIGAICLEKNDDREAENFFRYALEHTERIIPDERSQVFSRMDKLAKCLVKEKKYEEAEAIYLKGLSLWTKPSRNGSEARANFALGNLYVLEKKYEEAVPVLQTALRLAEEYYGPSSVSLLPYLQRNADLAYYMGQNEQRIEFKSRVDTISGIAVPPVQ